MDLELIGTDELIDELSCRCEAMVVAVTGLRGEDASLSRFYSSGNLYLCLGLLAELQYHILTEDRTQSSEEMDSE